MALGRVERRPQGRTEPKQPTQVRIVSAVAAASVLTVTFDQPVVLRGVPEWTTDVAGATVLSATSPSPTVVEMTFSAAIAAATEVNIPVADPSIRSKVGGFVADTLFPV